jgi:hypothetical protein
MCSRGRDKMLGRSQVINAAAAEDSNLARRTYTSIGFMRYTNQILYGVLVEFMRFLNHSVILQASIYRHQ